MDEHASVVLAHSLDLRMIVQVSVDSVRGRKSVAFLVVLLAACGETTPDTRVATGADAGTNAGSAAACQAVETAFEDGAMSFAGKSTCTEDADCRSVLPRVKCPGGQIEMCPYALNAADGRAYEELLTTLGDSFCALRCGFGTVFDCGNIAANPRCIAGICRTQGEY